tara:strand:- start:107 stop:355 length:249 start_codon:yes stop_codon:yes gene_type:complete
MEKNSDKSIRLCDSYCKIGDIILKIKINMIWGKETDLNEIVKSLKEIFKTKFNSNPKKLKELEDEIQTLRNTQEYINQIINN